LIDPRRLQFPVLLDEPPPEPAKRCGKDQHDDGKCGPQAAGIAQKSLRQR
jgi:hypothetical protein